MPDDFIRVLDIQRTGSIELRNRLLNDLKDDAFKIVRNHCRKFGREPMDEELIESLYALNEAIDKFDQKKESSFQAFFQKVIKARLVDFFRKERHEEEEFIEFDSENIALLSDRRSYEEKDYTENLRGELIRFNRIIGNLGYNWSIIMNNRPKRKDSLNNLQNIAWHIVNVGLGKRYIVENPMSKELRKLIGADRRILKKYRPYLCALVIVFYFDDFPIIRSHLNSFRKEGPKKWNFAKE